MIDAVGPGVAGWEPGQPVGVGWNGGYCGHCDHCRRGEFFACVRGQVTGVTYDGGYGEYMIAPASAVALMPAGLPPVDAAPLMCAGSPRSTPCGTAAPAGRRRRGARAGRTRPSRRSVCREDGLSHGRHRPRQGQGSARPPAWRIGLHRQPGQDPRQELLKLGGAKVILATATSGDAMSAVQGGLAVNGTLLIVGAAASMQVSPLFLLTGCRSVKGWYSGTSIDSQDTLAFSVRTGVRSMNETYPAGARLRGLRPHDERQGTIPGRADHE